MNLLAPQSYIELYQAISEASKGLNAGRVQELIGDLVNPYRLEDLYHIPWQNAGQWLMVFSVFPHLSMYLESVTIPNYTFTTHEHTKAITGVKFLGDVTIVFREDNFGTVHQVLQLLEFLIWDKKTKVFRDNQKASLQNAIVTMDEIHPNLPTIMWDMRGLKYKGMADHSLAGFKGDSFKITTTWSVKQIYPRFLLNGYGLLF